MLQHEQRTEPEPLSAAETRVTAADFSRAIAALQEREEEKARWEAETLPIGEAVETLQLESTPEEIHAEIVARRAASAPSINATRPKRIVARLWLTLIVLSGGLIAYGLAISPPLLRQMMRAYHTITAPRPAKPGMSQADYAREFREKLPQTRGAAPSLELHLQARNALTADVPAYPLSAIPDGALFYGSEIDFLWGPHYGEMLSFCPVKADDVRNSSAVRNDFWAFVRYNGRYYVRGWITDGDKLRLLRHEGFIISRAQVERHFQRVAAADASPDKFPEPARQLLRCFRLQQWASVCQRGTPRTG